MKNKLIKFVKREWLTALMVLAALAILIPAGISSVVLYPVGFALVIAAVSHLTRKVLFPYINMESFAKKALERPEGAGMVFAGVAIMLAFIMLVTGLMVVL